MSQHSESPEEDPDFQDLEEKLAQLKPMAPSDSFTKRINHRFDAMERDRAEKKIVWVRFAPVAAAACVVLTSTFLFRGYLLQQQTTGSDGPLEPESFESMFASGPDSGPAPVIDDRATESNSAPGTDDSLPGNVGPSGFFVPAASKGNFFLGAENVEIVGTREGSMPVREWKLGFDDAGPPYDSETNLPFLIPRQEFIWAPAAID